MVMVATGATQKGNCTMEYQRHAIEEAELLLPPPARWLRGQGREKLRYPDAVRQAVDRAAASVWEHIAPVFRPLITARLGGLWLKAGPCTRLETLGPRIVLAVTDDSRLPELYPHLRYTVGHLMAYALLGELAAIGARASRRTGAAPSLWQGAASALWDLVLQGGPWHTPGVAHAATGAMAKALLAAWGLPDPGEIRPRRGQPV
jgi:hypothetical protein